MIDIMAAQANQTTTEQGSSDWTVTLGDELLYSLPSHYDHTEVFAIRDIVHKMMERAKAEMQEREQQLCIVKMKRLVELGDAKLDYLKEENEKLATALEQHILSEEVA